MPTGLRLWRLKPFRMNSQTRRKTASSSQPYQQPAQQQSAPGIEQQWRTYRIESGKTLAQLFRDHGLPATDVYAMAQVEGAGKPLSTLQSGQTVQIRQNANGVVTGLTIDTGNGQQGAVHPPVERQLRARAINTSLRSGRTPGLTRPVFLFTQRIPTHTNTSAIAYFHSKKYSRQERSPTAPSRPPG